MNQSRNDFFSIFLVIMIVLNTIVLLNNIVTENHAWAALNFVSGILLLVGFENRRKNNDQ